MGKAAILVAAPEGDAPRLAGQLVEWGWTVSAAVSSLRDAVEAATRSAPDLALIDLGLDDGAGVEAAEALAGFGVAFVYIASDADGAQLRRARQTAPYGFLSKPLDETQVRLNVGAALAMCERERQAAEVAPPVPSKAVADGAVAAALGSQGDARAGVGAQAATQFASWMRMVTDAIDVVSDAIAVVGFAADGRPHPLVYNQSMQALIGPPRPDMEWQDIAERHGIYHADRVTPYTGEGFLVSRALGGKSDTDMRMFVRNEQHPDGADIVASAGPLRDAGGGIVGCVVVARDVTALRQSEERLRQSNEALQRQLRLMDVVVETMGDGLIVADENEKYLIRNASALTLAGDYVPTTTFEDVPQAYGLFHLDLETPLRADEVPLTRAVRFGESTDDVEMFIRPPGSLTGRYVSVSGRPLRDEAGAPSGGVIVMHDVTERVNRERRLRETVDELEYQSELLRTVFQNIDAGLVVVDEAGRYLMHNAAMERMTGAAGDAWRLDPEAGEPALRLPDGTLVPAPEHPLARVVRGIPTEGAEMLLTTSRRPEGVRVRVSAIPLRDERGTDRGGVAVYSDVTAARRSEDALRRAAERYRGQSRMMESVVDSMGDAVLLSDAKGVIVHRNAAAERLIGAGVVRNGKQSWAEQFRIFSVDRMTPLAPDELPMARALRGEDVRGLELFVNNDRIPEGLYVNVNASPLFGADGALEGSVLVFRDVTARHMAYQALSEAFAEGRLEMLDTLLHNVGNAVNSVATGVSTVRDQLRNVRLERRLSALASALEEHADDPAAYLESDPQGRQALPFLSALAGEFEQRSADLLRVVERVDDRVQHIVDIIRTQRSFGPGRAPRKQVVLRRSVDAAVKVQHDSIVKRGIVVAVDCSRAPHQIWVEDSRFQQVLVNLVKNAVEAIDELAQSDATEEPRSAPRIGIDAYTEGEYLVVDVTDTGIGIPAERFRAIFGLGFSTKPRGTGLGLHSSANFAIAAGGNIEPLSDGVGKGATMRVRLRLAWLLQKSRPAGVSRPGS